MLVENKKQLSISGGAEHYLPPTKGRKMRLPAFVCLSVSMSACLSVCLRVRLLKNAC